MNDEKLYGDFLIEELKLLPDKEFREWESNPILKHMVERNASLNQYCWDLLQRIKRLENKVF